MLQVEHRVPPQNLDAEQGVLGSIMLDSEAFAAIEGILVADQFYKESHRKIFRAMDRLFRQGDPIDIIALGEELRRSGELEGVGNFPYLMGLMEMVPTAAYADYYAKLVAEKSVLRELISSAGGIMQKAYDHAQPLEDILDQAESSIFQVSNVRKGNSFQSMNQLVGETFTFINEMHQNPDPVSGLRTGFKELDQLTAGLQPSSLNVLAARPSMGKTAAALTIGQHAALREGKSVAVFSLEMSSVQLVTRMLCSEARVDMGRIRNGQLSDRDFQRIADTAGRMTEAQIFIDDSSSLTVTELRSRARRLKAEHDLGLVIIDYLQLMSGGNTENRQQEISNISRGLKSLARELDIPVLALSQLSRAVEGRPNKRPMLSDLRECVTGDTLVNLADGNRVPIAELVGKQPEVFAMNPEGKIVTAVSDKVWPVGDREVFEVRLASGRVRRTTAGHLWYSFDGWQPLEKLKPGDRVAIARRLPEIAATSKLPDEAVALLGQRSGEKRLPEIAFSLPEHQQALLLRHLWAADGCITVRNQGEKSSSQVYFSAGSRLLADDVAALLLRLGIVAHIRMPETEREPYTVTVSGTDQQRLFLDKVGAYGQQVAQATQLAATPGTSYGGTSHYAPVKPSADIPEDDELALVSDSDLYWDEIASITTAGTEEVYDLTVPGPASWLADGVVMHNSGAVEQDADLVMFIYRDEYYDPHSDQQGIAEIIIGKQRNGPVGTVKLQFHGSHVRFNDLAQSN